jgi:NAD(P)-dependent dehydrogenase (short-subunit alcohol dehydrogenase family)
MAAAGELRFDDRAAIVTGAGRGLGNAYARLLAARGAAVIVNDRDRELAEGLAVEIEAEGGRAVADGSDVSTPDGAGQLIKTAVGEFGRLDVIVNNAGVVLREPITELSVDAIDRTIAVNLRGTLLVAHAAWPHLESAGHGRIVNATSASGLIGNPQASSYGATKAGIVGFTRVLAQEGQAVGIHANAISPLALTRMTDTLGIPGWTAETMGPGLVAPVVAYLAHEECELNGEVLSAGGGRVARYFVGLNMGWTSPGELRPEDVRDNLDSIVSLDDYIVPRTTVDELGLLDAGGKGGGDE